MKSSISALAAAALAGLAGGIGPAAPAAAQEDGAVQIKVCNNSGRPASAAIAHMEVGADRFVTRGWYDVASGQCAVLATTNNTIFYLYADATDGSGRFWGGQKTLCVQYPGPFTQPHDGSSYCPGGMDTRDFMRGEQTEPGEHTFNLE